MERGLKTARMAQENPVFTDEQTQKTAFDSRSYSSASLVYLGRVLQTARGATAFTFSEHAPADIWKLLEDPTVKGMIERALNEAIGNPKVDEELHRQGYLYLTGTTGGRYHPSELMSGYHSALLDKGRDTNYWEALARVVSTVGKSI